MRSTPTDASAVQMLDVFAQLIDGVAKPAATKDLQALIVFIQQHPNADWTTLSTATTPPAKRTSSGSKSAVRGDVVAAYAERLQANLYNHDAFTALFNDLSASEQLTGSEVIAIAKAFTQAGGRSKSDALKRIWNRHARLMTDQAKGRATGGRSAA
jgi:hypothetical protein